MHEIALYLPGILLAYSARLLGLASPGPNILAVIGTSMGTGRSAGLALALAVAARSAPLWVAAFSTGTMVRLYSRGRR